MEILGIGFPELILILIILLLVMGPEDIQKAARTLGRGLRKLKTSGVWQSIHQIRQELQWVWWRIEQEASLEETVRKIQHELTPEPPATPPEEPASPHESLKGPPPEAEG